MRSEGIKCLEPEHKADFSGLNFFWKSCENTAQLESKTSNWGESEVPVLHLTTDRHFSVQNKGFSDQTVNCVAFVLGQYYTQYIY